MFVGQDPTMGLFIGSLDLTPFLPPLLEVVAPYCKTFYKFRKFSTTTNGGVFCLFFESTISAQQISTLSLKI
jgi:hypothetical protein